VLVDHIHAVEKYCTVCSICETVCGIWGWQKAAESFTWWSLRVLKFTVKPAVLCSAKKSRGYFLTKRGGYFLTFLDHPFSMEPIVSRHQTRSSWMWT